MRKVLSYGVLLIACTWCCPTLVQAALRKPENPVHKRRQEEKDKRREVYGLYIKEQVAEEKREREARKAEAEKKKLESDRLKISPADTLEIVSPANTMDIGMGERRVAEEDALKGRKDQINPKEKKVSGPKVIIIEPQK